MQKNKVFIVLVLLVLSIPLIGGCSKKQARSAVWTPAVAIGMPFWAISNTIKQMPGNKPEDAGDLPENYHSLISELLKSERWYYEGGSETRNKKLKIKNLDISDPVKLGKCFGGKDYFGCRGHIIHGWYSQAEYDIVLDDLLLHCQQLVVMTKTNAVKRYAGKCSKS